MQTWKDFAQFAPKFPRKALAPSFESRPGELTVSGMGRNTVFGYFACPAEVEAGARYRLRVRFRACGVENIAISAMNMILWRIPGRMDNGCPHDGVMYYTRCGEDIIGEDCFTAPHGAHSAEIQLGLRYSGGSITWLDVDLAKVEPVPARPARISVCKWTYGGGEATTADENTGALRRLLDEAGAAKSDLFLLPEFSCFYEGAGVDDVAETVDEAHPGRVLSLLREKAVQYKMYVCAGLIESEGDILYNTAVLLDRQGALIGKYRKTHLYWPEGMWDGMMPGDDYPVFDLDFGRVGIMICYDSWFSEPARLYGLKGAELLLLPNAGYEPLSMPARAIDNSVYLAISSLMWESAIYNTLGLKMCTTLGGVATATIDFSKRPSPHANAGGILNGSGGGRREMHHTVSMELYRKIVEEVDTWADRPAPYTWME